MTTHVPRTWTSVRSGVLLLTAALASSAVSAQTPALPALPLQAYPDRTRESVAPLYEAAVARPNDAAAAGALGRSLQAWQQLDDAHAAYRRAQALAPKAFDWIYLDAVVLQRLGRDEEAVEQFQKALAISPGYQPARVKLAEALLKSGRLDESRRLYESLRSERLTEPFSAYGLGRIAAAEGRQDAALPHLERSVELFKEWGEAYYALAIAYRRLGRPEDANRAMSAHSRFGATVPGLEDPVLAATAKVRSDAAANLQRGIALKDAGDVDGAIGLHEAAVAQEPSFAQAHLNLIILYGGKENWAKVEEHYRKAVALGFGLGDVNYNYGYAQERQGKWDLAEAAYRRSIEFNPHHFRAHMALGLALDHRKAFEPAAAAFRLAADIDPTSRGARFFLARSLVELAKFEEAIGELQKILEPRDAETPSYLFALALAHARASQVKEAGTRAREARQLAVTYGQTDLVAEIDRTFKLAGGTS